MLFSSNIFIFIFLPVVIFLYYGLLRGFRAWQNFLLCIFSLFFYAWGEPRFVLIMMTSIVFNWVFALIVDKCKRNDMIKGAKLAVFFDILFNLAIIFVFKYLMFTVENINQFFNTDYTIPQITLPIGISFFTFQAISYVVDVYREKGEAQRNIINVGLYISFFPQLIAGPIVRYETIADQIKNRKETYHDFSEGIVRFIVGLTKKVLLSNSMAVIADQAFLLVNEDSGTLSVAMAWLGAIAYTLQIFFDFSGYSDMAIGLGKMFGFHFLENFNYPYISKSATEFWRRWHMSLGTWFRDYVYIPLGGSRVSTKSRHIFNLFVVWLCTGIWHGANWTFIVWGMMYFVLLTFEKYSNFNILDGGGVNFIKHCYTLFFVIMGWVVFRAENMGVAIEYYGALFGLNGNSAVDGIFIEYIRQYAVYLVFGIIFSMPAAKIIRTKIKQSLLTDIIYAAIMIMLFVVSVSFIVKGSYNPFIYFNF